MNTKTLNHAKGFAYEKHVLETLRKKYDNIWLWKDVPESILFTNKIIMNYENYCETRKDIGIDIVAIKNETVEYIQCKNYENNVCIDDIAGFLFFMIINNVNGTLCYSNGISSNIIKSIKEKEYITKLKINLVHIPYENNEIEIFENEKLELRNYQKKAINIIENNNKVIISMPCGTGKTYTACMSAKKYNNVILLSPLKKLAHDILQNAGRFLGNDYNKILISSDGTRDVNMIVKSLSFKNIISVTYDSVDILIEFANRLRNTIIIVDEFHNLSNSNLNTKTNPIYKLLNTNEKIIYMSATPTFNVKYDAVYKYDWKTAINNEHICDFNITIPTKDIIENENLQKMIALLKDIKDVNEKFIKKGYFIVKSLLYNGNKKCIIYTTTIDKANIFYSILIGILKLMQVDFEIHIITNKTRKKDREYNIYKFRKSDILSIIINVHILDEGIDIPECDSIYVTQPNNNIENLIQRMCRCNRRIKTKKSCNMYLWSTEKKTQKILEYIQINTYDDISEKINIYNPLENEVKKHTEIIQQKKKNIINKKETSETLETNSMINKNDKNIKKEKTAMVFKQNNELIEFIKHSAILPCQFICDFATTFYYCNFDESIIDFDMVVYWFGVRKDNIKSELLKKFKENVDYTSEKKQKKQINSGGMTTYYEIKITIKCFEELCITFQVQKAKEIRHYIYELKNAIVMYNKKVKKDLYDKLGVLKHIKQKESNNIEGILHVIKQKNIDQIINIDSIIENESYISINLYNAKHIEDTINYYAKNTKKYDNLYAIDYDVFKELINHCPDISDELQKCCKYNNNDVFEKIQQLKMDDINFFVYIKKIDQQYKKNTYVKKKNKENKKNDNNIVIKKIIKKNNE